MTKTPSDPNLEPFFEAARAQAPELPEHARRRILLEAEALMPKPAQPAQAPTIWARLARLFGSLPANAAIASLALGLGVGLFQPDSISSLSGLELLTSAGFEEEDAGFGLFLGAYDDLLTDGETSL